MSYSWLLTNFLAAFLLLPLNLLLMGVAGMLLLRRRRRLGRWLIGLALGGLWLLSTPIIADLLLDSLKPTPIPLTGKEAEAIVILGGGRHRDSLEYGGDTLGRHSLERVRYGIWLAKRLRKPIMVTGGAPDGGTASEGGLMRDMIRDEYGMATQWVEQASRNTRENARFSAEILAKAGIRRIYLVTHAWHMKRAMPEFEAAGLYVVPAGTGYTLHQPLSLLHLLPAADALQRSNLALHEWVGIAWYKIRN
jgi:uncharacterized SAM-binding protein YcdF (DUF218 family)